METKEFIDQLNKIQDLIFHEEYKEAMKLLENLKEIEKQGDFNYNLTHKLYQLDSNVKSLYNQKVILDAIFEISKQEKSITFSELKTKLETKNNIYLDKPILKREIEILILRNLLSCKVEEDKIIF